MGAQELGRKCWGRVNTPPIACTIAGTDSGGSAGLAADLASFAAHRVHGVFAVSVVTAQNTTGIVASSPMPAAFVGSQIDALTADFDIVATKTGMLYSPDVVAQVTERVEDLGHLVVDPVLVSSNGSPIFDEKMQAAYVEQLFGHAAVITPNVAEASLLTSLPITNHEDAALAASRLREMGAERVLVTGLLVEHESIDVFCDEFGVTVSSRSRIATENVLGTGCSLSAAITALVARGWPLRDAIDSAAEYVHVGIVGGSDWKLGSGRGPIDHFAPSLPKPTGLSGQDPLEEGHHV